MRRFVIAAAAALLLAPSAASAQGSADNFSYYTPSGMFGEGYAKWQMYRFVHEDQERTARYNADHGLVTGSIRQPTYAAQPSVQRARRPGEPDPRREQRW